MNPALTPSASPAADLVLGLDLGGSSVKAALLTTEGRTLREESRAFDAARPRHFADTVRDMAREWTAGLPARPVAIGMSAPGLPDAKGRAIAYLPNRLPGIEGLDWSEFLGLGHVVPLLNDAQAALLGENWLGAARGRSNVMLLTLGTGVGGAAMVDGRLLRGHVGKAGHLGHISLDPNGPPDICGTPGSLELAIGNANIFERSGGRFVTTLDLIQAHRTGDPAATRIWLASVRALAAGIASLTNVLDPEIVVIGGGVAAAGDALFLPLRRFLASMEWRVCGHAVQVVPAELGDKAGAIGAAFHAMRLARPGAATA